MNPAPRHLATAHATHYARGTLPGPAARALEAHVEACGSCAALVSAEVRRTGAGPALAAVRAGLLAAVARETATAPAPSVPHPATPARAG
ncbi:zf-HC2 domain-containing protein, partial [Streptomyces sp. SPB074]|uniref:zf-HC2 domain-containing protein n=1 Tax=Streptomyces sp. (strain SPB074) TaxID=465543 RepID=UPI00056A8832